MSFKSIRNESIKVDKPIGTIGIVCSDQARYSHFTGSLARMMQQWPQVNLEIRIGLQLTRARNQIVKAAQGDWIWWLDDDHVFGSDLLEKLLTYNVDIVGPLYIMRQMPPLTTARVIKIDENGEKQYGVPNIWQLPPRLYEVDCIGTSGMLVRRHVWEAMDQPYFKVGHVQPDTISEDLYFCEQAKAKGFKIFLDTSTVMAHIANTVLKPKYEDGQWKTELMFPNGSIDIINGPIVQKALEKVNV
jgi:glycosyltransferase involved in cell wall biosynthesis